MEIWHTWLAFLGVIAGLIASRFLGTSLLRSGAIGFAAGIAVVVLVNVINPVPAPCLQNAKGGDILRAYSLDCAKNP